MKRIHGMGVNKVVVTALQPLGCLPRSTFTSSFQQCNGTENELVGFHNLLLQQAVTKLNNETKDSTFAILDLYKAFMAVFKIQGKTPGLFLYFFSYYMKQLVHSKPAWRLNWLAISCMLSQFKIFSSYALDRSSSSSSFIALLRKFEVRESVEAMLHWYIH
jgi:hypothetical protein